MKLSYKFYRTSLVKLTIFSVLIIFTFWDHLRGKGNPKDESGALILLAVLMVVGWGALFIGMRRAKRKEQAEILKAKTSDGTKLTS